MGPLWVGGRRAHDGDPEWGPAPLIIRRRALHWRDADLARSPRGGFGRGISADAALSYRSHPIVSKRRLELPRLYFLKHYALDSAELKDPRIIVIQATEIPTLEAISRSASRTSG
jgi:hypothetical protein